MTAGDALPPEAVQATDEAGAALIDGLVARRRAELARLSLAARTARQRCERAESALSGLADGGVDGVPADLLGVVDAMLEKAVAASELALASAEREATFIIDRAIADRARIFSRAGLDPERVPLTPRRPATARSVAPPPSAADLWRGARRPIVAAPVAAPAVASVLAPPPPLPPMAAVPAFGGAGALSATLIPAPAVATAPTNGATLLLEEPAEGSAGPDDQAGAYDRFWQEVPGERRVRDRLRRRSPKEGV